MLLLQLR